LLFPFLKVQLGVGYIELGFALTVFGVVSGLTQAPIGYLADHIGARKVLLIGLTVGGVALIMLGMHLSYTSLIVCAALLGLANSVYHPCDYAILSTHMDEARMGRAFSIHTFARVEPRMRGSSNGFNRENADAFSACFDHAASDGRFQNQSRCSVFGFLFDQ